MERINIFNISIVCLLFVCGCSEIDNYSIPDAGIYGNVIDEVSDAPLETEQPYGYRIQMIEDGYDNPIPFYFWGMKDGTFRNSKVFSGRYEIVPVEGAFFPPESKTIEINGSTEVNFTVTPYLSVKASVKREGNSIITSYTIGRTKIGEKIAVRATLCSENPNLNNTVWDNRVAADLSEIDDSTILSTQFSDTVKNLQAGRTYYVRVAAATANALSRYNYSEVFEVKM